MKEGEKIERKRKLDLRSHKLEGSRRCKLSPEPEERIAKVHTAPNLKCHTDDTFKFLPWGCLPNRAFFFCFNFLKVYPGGVVFVLKYLKFKSIPRGCRFFEFCSFKTMGFCEGTACVHALTAATHNINIMSSNAKEKKKSWRLNFLLTCVKYSSALSAPKPFVQTSF